MKTVLLVDDEPLTTQAVEKMIIRSGGPFRVVGRVSGGLEALSFLKKQEVDIALVDIRMPGMDGIALMQAAQDLPVHFIVLSAYRDFEYARQALRLGADNYLLKPLEQDKLMRALEQSAEQIEAESQSRSASQAFSMLCRKNAVGALLQGKISEYVPESFRLPGRGSLVLLQGSEEFPGPFVEDCCQLGWEPYRDTAMAAFVPEDRLQDSIPKIRQAQLLSEAYYMEHPVAVFSAPDFTADALAGALEQCQAAARFAFYLPDSPVLKYSSLKSCLVRPMGPVVDAFRAVTEQLACTKEELLQKFQNACTLLQEEMSLPPQAVYRMFYELLGTLQSVNLNPEGSVGPTLQDLYNLGSLPALCRYTGNAIASWQIAGDRETESVERAKAYCRKHFAENCSLEEIAASVYLSPAYLSRLFKSRENMSIWTYLTNLRMDRAKYLLLHTQTMVSKVGELVGYPNHSYFTRVFRSCWGVSPREFRIHNREKKNL